MYYTAVGVSAAGGEHVRDISAASSSAVDLRYEHSFGHRPVSQDRQLCLSMLERLFAGMAAAAHTAPNDGRPLTRAVRAVAGGAVVFAWASGSWSSVCVCSSTFPPVTAYAYLKAVLEAARELDATGDVSFAAEGAAAAAAVGLLHTAAGHSAPGVGSAGVPSNRLSAEMVRLLDAHVAGDQRDKISVVRNQLAQAQRATVENARRLQAREEVMVELAAGASNFRAGADDFAIRSKRLAVRQRTTVYAMMAALGAVAVYFVFWAIKSG